MKEIIKIKLSKIDSFKNHPFKVNKDDSLNELITSIKANGLLNPLVVREKENGRYEMISGHRRKLALELSGIDEADCYIEKLDDVQRKEIDNMVLKGLLKFDSSLFSKPEQDYLNYYLNKSEFINSLDLRNMYSHGTQPFGNESIHHSNYIKFLKILVLIIIKINDELCINDEINY